MSKLMNELTVPQEVRDQEFLANRNEHALDANEARLRILVHQLPTLMVLPIPNKVLEALEKAQREGAKPKAVDSLRTILQAAEGLSLPIPVQEISGDNAWGHVEVIWGTNRSLRWLVREPRIRWPGVSVRVFYTSGEIVSSFGTFWTAHTLLGHFEGFCGQP